MFHTAVLRAPPYCIFVYTDINNLYNTFTYQVLLNGINRIIFALVNFITVLDLYYMYLYGELPYLCC